MSLSSRTALLTGVAIGSSLTLLIAMILSRRPIISDTKITKPPNKSHLPSELRDEQLSRHLLYFGESGMQKITSCRICVIGLGGVGSHTAHMLARAGVRFLRLVDFDQVTLSSLNRHACATLADVGIPKAICLQQFLQKLCPDPTLLELDARVEMYTAESSERLLGGDNDDPWTLVIDAIDDVPTKAHLIGYCLENNIRIISCMGAGGKADVTRLHISDLRTASRDPLASKLRQQLKTVITKEDNTYLEDMHRLTVLYSSEKPVVKLADFTEEQQEQGVENFGAVSGMRIRVVPVLGTMPAIMGQALAAIALTEIGQKPFQPVTGERVGRNVRNKVFQHLKRREELISRRVLSDAGLAALPDADGCIVNGTWIGPLRVDQDDVEYLWEVWRNRCAVSGARLGTTLQLVRWDESRPSTCDNLVLMSAHSIQKFDMPKGKEAIPPEIQLRIQDRLGFCRTS